MLDVLRKLCHLVQLYVLLQVLDVLRKLCHVVLVQLYVLLQILDVLRKLCLVLVQNVVAFQLDSLRRREVPLF